MVIDEYLKPQSTEFIMIELDQAMAQAHDTSMPFEKRDQAFSAAYFLARELERRKESGKL